MFGINGSEFIVLLVVAAVVLGPERLPQYAQQLARLVRELRRMAQGASEQMRSELGPEFDEIDWRKLDPRQYDPRRIVREALADSDLDPDDPLGLRDAGLDRSSLGVDAAGTAAASGGPATRRRPARPRPADGPANLTADRTADRTANGAGDGTLGGTTGGTVNGAPAAGGGTAAVGPALDDVPLDPDAP